MMNIENSAFEKTTAYEISIGIKSMISRQYFAHIDDIKAFICEYLYDNKVDFSLKVINGGYTYSDDTFNTEKTIVLTFINGNFDFIKNIAAHLKTILEQESILVVKRELGVAYL